MNSREDYYLMILLAAILLLSLPICWKIFSLQNWFQGKRLFFNSLIVWLSWWLSSIGTMFLLVTLNLKSNYSSRWVSQILLIAVIVFVATGFNSGILYLLKKYQLRDKWMLRVWRVSFKISLGICLFVFGFLHLGIYYIENYTVKDEIEHHCSM